MAGWKGNRSATREETHDSSNKSRGRASSHTTESVGPAYFNARPSPRIGPSLDTMPTEILQQILYASCEPRLIHTCRSLYERLPDSVGWIKSMAILAFTPRGPMRQNPTRLVEIPTVDFPAVDLPVPEAKVFIDPHRINTEVCRSRWLTPVILHATHLTLFKHFLYTTILSPEMPLYLELRAKVEQELHTLKDGCLSQSSEIPSLSPLRCPGNRFDGYTISLSGCSVKVEWPRNHPAASNEHCLWDSFRIFETEMVPDCVVKNTADATSCGFTRILQISHHSPTLLCSHELMQRAILEAMKNPKILPIGRPVASNNTFRLLSELNQVCNPAAPLTTEMLAVAVEKDHVRMLSYILGAAPRDHGKEVWDFGLEDLLRLELGLQHHQHWSYSFLADAITWRFRDDIGQQVAEKLGFRDVRTLNAARSAVHAMLCQNEEPCHGPLDHFPDNLESY